MNHIRTLTFDLDDTLWDNRAVLMAAEQALYDWLDGNYPRIAQRYSLEAMRRMRIDLVRQDPGWRNRISELRKHALRLAAVGAYLDAAQAVDPLPPAAEPDPRAVDEAANRETWDDALRLQAEGVEPARFAAVTCSARMFHGACDREIFVGYRFAVNRVSDVDNRLDIIHHATDVRRNSTRRDLAS